MARGLDWFQARALARLQGRRIRREAWRKWLRYDAGVYLWYHYQPPGQTTFLGGVQQSIPEALHVVRASEFQAAEFLALDWTDEDWNANSGGGTPPNENGGDDTGGSGSGGGTNGPGTGEADGEDDNDDADDDAEGDDGGGTAPGAGDGGESSDSGGEGTWGGGGGGGLPGGGNGGGGKKPKPPPPQADYTPTVELTLDADTDGPSCFIIVPDEGTAFVSVSVPNPQGGTARVLGLTVTCLGQTKTQTVGPGVSTGFTFKGPIGPGGTVRATATARDFNAHSWTGADTDQWPPNCLLPIYTWSGSKTVTHRCNHGSGGQDGFDVAGNYSTTAQYAVHPAPGSGKAGTNTGADFNDGDNMHETTTPYPGGTPNTVDSFLPAPGGITCDVAANGQITNVLPATMGQYPPSGTTTTGTPPDDCTETTTASESGPNGAE